MSQSLPSSVVYRRFLWSAALITIAVHALPFGWSHYLLYPFVLLSTMAHELGHGWMASALGGNFEALSLHADASGVAQWSGRPSSWQLGLIAGAGLIGPAMLAMCGFLAARRTWSAKIFTALLTLVALFAAITVVRNPFGLAFVVALSAVGAVSIWKASPQVLQFGVSFLAIQLALSVFSRGDYLFTAVAQTASGTMPSDVAQMASALGGPYWLWGVVCGGISLAVMLFGCLERRSA